MINNHFDKGSQGWCSYDYHASMVAGGRNVFILATWSPQGGVDGSGCVFTDHVCWSADTPERPLSILPLLCYHGWAGAAESGAGRVHGKSKKGPPGSGQGGGGHRAGAPRLE